MAPKYKIQRMINAGHLQSHECYPKLDRGKHLVFRCNVCGKVLRQNYFSTNIILQEPFEISYFESLDVSNQALCIQRSQLFVNYTKFQHLLRARDYCFTVMDQPQQGFGFLDYFQGAKQKIPSAMEMCEVAVKGHLEGGQQFQFVADYESSNLEWALVSCDSSEVRVALRQDTNARRSCSQWFNFSVVNLNSKMNKTVKFQIINCSLPRTVLEEGGASVTVGKVTDATKQLQWSAFYCENVSYY